MAAYDAFVSYSHAKDKPVAAALQSVIQRLGKPWYRRRALRVFRDDTSLSATPSLWPSIEQALGNSRFLILLASPEAAGSHWVNKEVSWWLDNKGADSLLIALTDGELAWNAAVGDFAASASLPLPPVLTGRFINEPKWIDLRAHRGNVNVRDSRFIEAGADFAAAIHDLPKEDLLSQEVRQQRQALRLASGAAATLAILIAVAGWQWWVAEAAKRTAQTQRDLAVRNFGIAKNAADDVVFGIAQSLRQVQGMQVESVRRILDTARSMMDELVRAAPDDLQLQRSRAAMLSEFMQTYASVGDLARARVAADEALAIARKLAEAEPDKVERVRDVSVSLIMVGDMMRATGDVRSARAAYEDALAMRRKLASVDPENPVRQHDLAVGLSSVGAVRMADGEWTAAMTAYEEALTINREYAMRHPKDLQWPYGMSDNLDSIGKLRLVMGDRPGALSAYEEALSIMRQLSAIHPTNAEWQYDVSRHLDRIADLLRHAGNSTGAMAVNEESLAIMRKLAAGDPSNTQWQDGLSSMLVRLGDVLREAEEWKRSHAAYFENLSIRRKLAAADPSSTRWQHNLSIALNGIGNLFRAMGERARARPAYEESLEIGRRLAAIAPSDVVFQVGLAGSLVMVSTVSGPERAQAVLREGLAILEALERQNRLPAEQKGWPQVIRDQLAKSRTPEQTEAR